MMALNAEAVVKELRFTYTSGKTKAFEWRVSQLKAILKITSNHQNDIIQALRSDLNKPEHETFLHEIAGVSSECELALKELSRWMKPEKAKTTINTFPSSAEIVYEPLGVILVISTWNYPFLLSLQPIIGAIAAGNAVVLKASELAPATSSLLLQLVTQYMDSSAVRVVEGNGKVGRIILAAAAKHLTPVVLELGGKCPAIVDSNVNLKVAAKRIISGKWGCSSGQTCVSPDYIITTIDFSTKLVDALKSELEKFYGKDPLESKDFSSIINSLHFDRLTSLLDDEKVSGKVVFGGHRDKTHLKIVPTIVLNPPDDSLMMNSEIFGPLLPIITVNKVEDSFDKINAKEKPLAAYLFTNDKKLQKEFIKNVSAGSMAINETALQLTELSLPFGGVGESGNGAYHGKFSFEAFSHKKPVLVRSFVGDVAARYPPYSPQKLQFLKAMLSGNLIRIIRALFD